MPMDTAYLIEAIGYLGSFLVLVSFLMTSVVRLRLVNVIGSVIFTIYALIIRSYPTVAMNTCLILINLRFLLKLRNKSAPEYQLVKVKPGDSFLDFFLTKYRNDIDRFFPYRTWKAETLDRAYLVCYEDKPVGVFLAEDRDGELVVDLDYTIESYRDSSVGKFLMEVLPKEGVRSLVYQNPEETHIEYLRSVGFLYENGVFRKKFK